MHKTEPSDLTTAGLLNECTAPADNPSMTIRSLIKVSLAAIAVPPALWLAGVAPVVASAAGLFAAVVLVAWACVEFTARHNARLKAAAAPRSPATVPVSAPAPAPAPEFELEFPAPRLDRTPSGRQARDVRCPAHSASRMTPRLPRSGRRSTRR